MILLNNWLSKTHSNSTVEVTSLKWICSEEGTEVLNSFPPPTGHINHSLFWQNLAPKSEGGGELPKGSLLSAIQKEWGSFENFVSQFNTAAAGVQGNVSRA